LPRALAGAAQLDLSRHDKERWSALVVDLVGRTRGSRAVPKPPLVPRVVSSGPDSFREFHTPALRLRGLHAKAWWNIDLTAAARDLEKHSLSGTNSPAFAALTEAIAPLEWDGKLASYDSWPNDPAIRDTRTRIGTLRCLFLSRTLTLDPTVMSAEQLSAEMTFLTRHRLPLLDEPCVPGRDEEARRWSVRHHLGALTRLAELFRRGLAVGVLAFSERDCELWADGLEERRLDCADSLFDL